MSYVDFDGTVKPTTDLSGQAAQENVSGIELINHNGKIGFSDAGHILERGSKVYGVMLQAKIAGAAPGSNLSGLSPVGEVRTIEQVAPYKVSVRWSDHSMTKIDAKDFFWDRDRNTWRVD